MTIPADPMGLPSLVPESKAIETVPLAIPPMDDLTGGRIMSQGMVMHCPDDMQAMIIDKGRGMLCYTGTGVINAHAEPIPWSTRDVAIVFLCALLIGFVVARFTAGPRV